MIRRTSELLAKHLPPKHEMVVFVRAAPLQRSLYALVLRTPAARSLAARGGADSGAAALVLIGALRKIATHPALVHARAAAAACVGAAADDTDDDVGGVSVGDSIVAAGGACGGGGGGGVGSGMGEMAGALALYPAGFSAAAASPEVSGKLALLADLLGRVKAASTDRWVVVSNFTAALDYIGRLCDGRGWGYERLDGTVETGKRQAMVDQFNSPHRCAQDCASPRSTRWQFAPSRAARATCFCSPRRPVAWA